MASEAPIPPLPPHPYLPPVPDTSRQIEVLNDNDVLLGRGLGPCHFIGNKRFRDLVDSRKAEYVVLHSYNEKAVIAWEVYSEVRRRGGRFLKLARVVKAKRGSNHDRIIYVEASEKTSIEKCKQALREKRAEEQPASATGGEAGQVMAGREREGEESKEDVTNEPSGGFFAENNKDRASPCPAAAAQSDRRARASVPGRNAEHASAASLATTGSPATTVPTRVTSRNISFPPRSVPQATLFGSFTPVAIDPRLLLFQQPLLAIQQQALLQQQQIFAQQQLLSEMLRLNSNRCFPDNVLTIPMASNQAYPPPPGMPSLQDLVQNQMRRSMLECRARDILLSRSNAPVQLEPSQQSDGLSNNSSTVHGDHFRPQDPAQVNRVTAVNSVIPAGPNDVAVPSSIEDLTLSDSAIALSALAKEADRPRFTEEQEAIEQASMTDEERALALCDLYGKYSADDVHQKKRSKNELDRRSIDFLIQYMRNEIEQYPVLKSKALLEAQEKCLNDEFSDRRLEGFLRCEGMNATLAAERFINYWESRREVFGPDKFHLPMALSQALKDDLVAIEAGVHRFLPVPDSFGRRILFIEPHRHTRTGYSSESLVRAIWYMIEVFIEESEYDGSGFITVVWDLHTTIYDYDSKVSDKMVYLCRRCFPLKTMPTHICCANPIIVRILKPLMKALMNKEARQRFLMHDAPPSGILGVLSKYGITKYVLPTEMGGEIQLDQIEWIACRRAIEMEEIG